MEWDIKQRALDGGRATGQSTLQGDIVRQNGGNNDA